MIGITEVRAQHRRRVPLHYQCRQVLPDRASVASFGLGFFRDGSGSPWALNVIRASRSGPPGLAASDGARRRTYGAALQQFDELLEAATTAGHASRPLPLFYALSQAGRAIASAYGPSSLITVALHY